MYMYIVCMYQPEVVCRWALPLICVTGRQVQFTLVISNLFAFYQGRVEIHVYILK